MTLHELSIKLQVWRKNKKSICERIPSEYWEEAIRHAKEDNPATVAKELGLNVGDLKNRMGLTKEKRKYVKKVNFKEVKLNQASPVKKSPVFELTTGQGITLKVYQ